MKIAFDPQIFTMQEYGGISRYICSLAAHLGRIEGVEAKIFAPFHRNAHLDALPREMVSGIRLPITPRTARAAGRCGFWLARSAIARYSPQIVHETYYAAKQVAPRGARTVVTVYDMIHERFPAMLSQYERTSERKFLATQRADHVICISQSTRSDLLELFDLPAAKVSVVNLGFDLLDATISQTSLKQPYLLYVGDRGSYKNFTGFLRAYANSPLLRENFGVVCFGGGSFSSNENKLFDDLRLPPDTLMQLNGNDSKLASLYRGAAVFVYPSLYEGFGIPPLEAMSLNCPVACSNTSSMPEIVGAAGEYFDPSDHESIRFAVERVLQSAERRSELITLGRSRCELFSWVRCAQETLEVYRNLSAGAL